MTGAAGARQAGRPRLINDETLLTTALKAFSERGFESVSMRDLNRELGVSHAMLAKRFGDKDALWRATVDFAFARHRDALRLPSLESPHDPADDLVALRIFLVEFVRTAALYPELQRLINLECCAETDRVDYLFDRCISPMLALIVRPILDRLEAQSLVRRVTDREVFFLVANGAASVFALAPLSQRFDASSGGVDSDAYGESIADLLMASLKR